MYIDDNIYIYICAKPSEHVLSWRYHHYDRCCWSTSGNGGAKKTAFPSSTVEEHIRTWCMIISWGYFSHNPPFTHTHTHINPSRLLIVTFRRFLFVFLHRLVEFLITTDVLTSDYTRCRDVMWGGDGVCLCACGHA